MRANSSHFEVKFNGISPAHLLSSLSKRFRIFRVCLYQTLPRIKALGILLGKDCEAYAEADREGENEKVNQHESLTRRDNLCFLEVAYLPPEVDD